MSGATSLPVIAESPIKPTKTIVFKKVGDLEIPLDIYLPKDADNKNLPVLLWYHGGGLLQGNRNQLASYMRRGVEKYQYAAISADYRFAPQASIDEILTDVLDCITFIRTTLATHLPPSTLNPSRLAVSGASAGGYLALLAGLYADPKPSVILPIYPITDPLGTFFTTSQPPPMSRALASHASLAPHLDPRAPPVANCPPLPHPRMHMYVRMMADASLASLYHIRAPPPGSAANSWDPEGADRWRVARQVYGRRLPPMYMLHGDADTCVGVEQADEVVGAAVGVGGVEVVYERVRGADHFLDTGAEYENEAMFRFMLKYV